MSLCQYMLGEKMIKAWVRQQKVKIELIRHISDWELDCSDSKEIINMLQVELKDALLKRIICDMQYEIEDTIKETLVEYLKNDSSIKEGINEHIKDKIREMLRSGY